MLNGFVRCCKTSRRDLEAREADGGDGKYWRLDWRVFGKELYVVLRDVEG
jgi:hypothetical protein